MRPCLLNQLKHVNPMYRGSINLQTALRESIKKLPTWVTFCSISFMQYNGQHKVLRQHVIFKLLFPQRDRA